MVHQWLFHFENCCFYFRNGTKEQSCYSTSLKYDEILPDTVEDPSLVDLIKHFNSASLLETEKPKKVTKRKKSSSDKERKNSSVVHLEEDKRNAVGQPLESVGQNVPDNVSCSNRGLHTPQRKNTPQSPKANKPFFQDNIKSAK